MMHPPYLSYLHNGLLTMTYLSKGKIHKYIQAILESLKGKKKVRYFKIVLLIYFLKRRFSHTPSQVMLALGYWPAVGSSVCPWGTEQHQRSASAISAQTQRGSGKLPLRTSILATFYSHRALGGAQLYTLMCQPLVHREAEWKQ